MTSTTGLYNVNGQQQVTIVAGTAITGLYAADGTFNGVSNDGITTIMGAYHPCGALNVSTTNTIGKYCKNGSRAIVVSVNGFALA